MVAVLTPMSPPRALTSGPPELPRSSAASVWIVLSIIRPEAPRNELPSPPTMPAVTVCWKTIGEPIAMAI
jgi:hypothetical protein